MVDDLIAPSKPYENKKNVSENKVEPKKRRFFAKLFGIKKHSKNKLNARLAELKSIIDEPSKPILNKSEVSKMPENTMNSEDFLQDSIDNPFVKPEINKSEGSKIEEKSGFDFSKDADKKMDFITDTEKQIKKENQKQDIMKPEEGHFLDRLEKVDDDIQIGNSEIITGTSQSPTKHPKIETPFYEPINDNPQTIEDIGFIDSKNKTEDDSFSINRLRKALGILKDKTEKDVKINEFKSSLVNESVDESELVTNLNLEEKLNAKIEGSPSQMLENKKFSITTDSQVDEGKEFKLSDGRILKSIRDLRNALENILDSVFEAHVKGRKNDFANWIKNTLGDVELAKIVRKCKTSNALLSMFISLEKKELEEVMKVQEEQILQDHKNSLKDINFIRSERENILEERKTFDKEKNSFDSIKKEYQLKLDSICKKESELEQEKNKLGLETDEYKQKEKLIEEEKKSLEKTYDSEKTTLVKSLDERRQQFEQEKKQFHEEFEHKYEEMRNQLNQEFKIKQESLEKARIDYLETIKKQSLELENLRKELIKQTEEHNKKLEEDFKSRSKELESEFNAKFISLESSLEDRRKSLESEFEEKNLRLKEERESFIEEQKQINTLYHSKLKELKVEEKKLFEMQKELKEQELTLVTKENEVRKKLVELSKKIMKSKNIELEIKKGIDSKNLMLLELKQKQAELENMKLDLERQGFQAYLNEKLKEITNSDSEELKKEIPQNVEDTLTIYNLIRGCKKLINAGKLDEAQNIYSGIRTNFYKMNLPKEEKQMLFNAIRELYTDIKIKAL